MNIINELNKVGIITTLENETFTFTTDKGTTTISKDKMEQLLLNYMVLKINEKINENN